MWRLKKRVEPVIRRRRRVRWAPTFLVALLTALSAVGSQAAGAEKAADDKALLEVLDVLGEGTAIVFVSDMIGPQFYNNQFIHHVLYEFAFLIDAEYLRPVWKDRLQLREVVLDELNSRSFAKPGAPKRINIPLLKKRVLFRARKLFSDKVFLRVYVVKAWPSGH